MLKTLIIVLIMWGGAEAGNKSCHDLLRQLADKQGKFIDCITRNSVPVTMCNICKGEYSSMLVNYDTITAQPNCSDMYFDKDRINMIASTESVLTGLWSKAYCPDCWNNNNSAIFDDKNEALDGCLNQQRHPCEQCLEKYLDLNNFYKHLDQYNNGEICFDIQDSMNRTRNKWSKELKCCRREYNMILFSVALGIFLSLPFIFYCSTYLITKRQERNHGILNDEDVIFNATTPSVSAARTNLNVVSNNPSTSRINNIESASTTATNNIATAAIKPSATKKGYNILDEEPEEYNPDASSSKLAGKKGVSSSNYDDDESSDDENIVINNKLKNK